MPYENWKSNSRAVQSDPSALERKKISLTGGEGETWQWRPGVQFQTFSGATLRTELDHRPRIVREGRIGDTREACADNLKRVLVYLDFLDRFGLSLPADAQWPNRLSVEIVAKEAGVARDVIASVGREARKEIDGRLKHLGLAEIVSVCGSRSAVEPVNLDEARGIVACQLMKDAEKAGRLASAMVRRVDALFTRLVHNAGGSEGSALAALRGFRAAADADPATLRAGVDDRSVVDQAITILEVFEAERRLSAESGVDDGLAASFSEALTQIVYGTGIPFHRVAQLAGVKAATLRHWMHDERVPDHRNEAALREICRIAGREPEGLLARIRRRRYGTARLYEADYPKHLHGTANMRIRSHLASRLNVIPERGPMGEDPHLTAAISALAADHDRHFARGRRRQKLRESARMGEPPEPFDREVEAYLDYLRDDRPIDWNREHEALKPSTIATYRNLLRRFGAFVASEHIDPSLRIDAAGLSLAHVALTPLWRAFFAHKLSYREESERLDTATVDRLHVALSLIAPGGYLAQSDRSMVRLREILGNHRRHDATEDTDRLLDGLHVELDQLRRTLRKSAAKPVPGMEVIKPVLDRERPMEVVERLLEVMIAKFEALGEASPHWPTRLRAIVLIQLLAQTGLRSHMFGELTCVGRNAHFVKIDGCYRLVVPGRIFKSDRSHEFRSGNYERRLDLLPDFTRFADLYLERARDRLLAYRESDRLFVTRGPRGAEGLRAHGVQHCVRSASERILGRFAPECDRIIGLDFLTPHHFRDILATTVVKGSCGDFVAAGDAIHVTEKTAREHYARFLVDDRSLRTRAHLEAAFGWTTTAPTDIPGTGTEPPKQPPRSRSR